MPKFSYKEFTSRNDGYITPEAQELISQKVLLIAGCGIGSTIAEAAVRMGFQNFILVDGDEVSMTNLNRQAYCFADIGEKKVSALAKRLKSINPETKIAEVAENLNLKNTANIVSNADFIFDTVDFLDLPAILNLHDQALMQKKPLLTTLSAGWGAAALYIPPVGEVSLIRHLFKVKNGEENLTTYTEAYKQFFSTVAQHLDPSIVRTMAKALQVMEDGTPCPASQISAGACSVAGLAMTLINQLYSGQKIATAPYLILQDSLKEVRAVGINLTL